MGKRVFDHLTMKRARELGATIREGATVTALTGPGAGRRNWTITAAAETFEAQVLVAADGRNSTVARLCNLLPRSAKERIALQTHLPLPGDFGNRVVLQFLPGGYSGQAPVGDGELNLCLVTVPPKMAALRSWAEAHFGISPKHTWRTITPLTRTPIAAAHQSLFFVGDAARVVEPFTGEGIYYACSGARRERNFATHGGTKPTLTTLRCAGQTLSVWLWINRWPNRGVISAVRPMLLACAIPPHRSAPYGEDRQKI